MTFYQRYVLEEFCSMYDIDMATIQELINQKRLQLTDKSGSFFSSENVRPELLTWINCLDRQIPVLFTDNNDLPVIEIRNDSVCLNFDIIGSAFYFLSGWQEIKSTVRDTHGRYPFKESLQYELNITEIPVVNYYFHILKDALQKALGTQFALRKHIPNAIQVCLSHDIDKINSGWLEGGFSELKKGSYGSAFSLLLNKLFGKDPWDNISEILALELTLNVPSTFFFLPSKGNGNADYRINQVLPSFEEIIAVKSEVALHGSLGSAHSSDKLNKEIDQFSKKIQGNRFHFLKYEPRTVGTTLDAVNIRYDGSFGFAEHVGFRHGVCHPFHPFNPDTSTRHSFLEIPLSIMDTTLSFASYMLHDEQKNSKVDRVISEAEKFNGIVSILWHNNYFSDYKYTGWKDRYIQLVTRLKNTNAKFYTHEYLADIYNA